LLRQGADTSYAITPSAVEAVVGSQQTASAPARRFEVTDTSRSSPNLVEVAVVHRTPTFQQGKRWPYWQPLDTTRGAIPEAAGSPVGAQQIASAPFLRRQVINTSYSFIPSAAAPSIPARSDIDPYVYFANLVNPSDGTVTTQPNVDASAGNSGGWPRVRSGKKPEVRDVPRETVEKIQEVAKRDFSELRQLQESERLRRIELEFQAEQSRVFLLVYLEVLNAELLRLQLEEEEALFLMLVLASED
jgi:hypothetical protein